MKEEIGAQNGLTLFIGNTLLHGSVYTMYICKLESGVEIIKWSCYTPGPNYVQLAMIAETTYNNKLVRQHHLLRAYNW